MDFLNKRSFVVDIPQRQRGVSEFVTQIRGMFIMLGICIVYAFVANERHFSHAIVAPYLGFAPTAILSVCAIYLMLTSRCRMAAYGFTLKGWPRALKESLLYSVVLMGLIVVIKYVCIVLDPQYANSALFNPGLKLSRTGDESSLYPVLGYVLFYVFFAFLQEMLARGFVQGLFYQFFSNLSKAKRVWVPIFLSNVIFGFLHLHISLPFAWISFTLGMVWGWLYSRHGTLVGVGLSHIVVGVFAFFIVGFYR